MTKSETFPFIAESNQDYDACRDYLRFAGTWTISMQQQHRTSIVAAFKMFWSSTQSEQIFAETMTGLVLFPEILYHMTFGRRPLVLGEEC